jgi:uncharacterized membrane protein YbhN (UPF0104 family)
MKFESRKGSLLTFTLFIILCFVIIITIRIFLEGNLDAENYWGFFILIALSTFIFWVFFDTSYELNEKYLKYKSGPISGKIEISRIQEVIKGKTLWVGINKFGLAQRGLIVKYGNYDEIYISPKTNDLFVEKLLELNGEIKITE